MARIEFFVALLCGLASGSVGYWLGYSAASNECLDQVLGEIQSAEIGPATVLAFDDEPTGEYEFDGEGLR